MSPDVVIIGGGPAGLSAAVVLGRHGVATTLVERGELPQRKPCGEGLLPNGVASLERLGISRETLAAYGHPMTGVRYYSPRGRVAECGFPDEEGIGIERSFLSALLLAQARRWPSVRVVTGTRAELSRRASGVEVTIGSDRVRPRLVIAADGLTSRTREAAGIAARVGPMRRWGLRQHFARCPWSSLVEVHFGPGFEAYVTPLADGVNVAVLWEPARVPVPRGDSPVLEMVRSIPSLAPRLSGATPLDRAAASGPFCREVATTVGDGVLLAGDAAGYVDAVTGEGVGLALLHAEAIEETVVPLLHGSSERAPVPARALAPFAAAVWQRTRPNRQLTSLLLRLTAHPMLVEGAIAALQASPGLFIHGLRVNMGERPLWSLRRPLFARFRRAAAR